MLYISVKILLVLSFIVMMLVLELFLCVISFLEKGACES